MSVYELLIRSLSDAKTWNEERRTVKCPAPPSTAGQFTVPPVGTNGFTFTSERDETKSPRGRQGGLVLGMQQGSLLLLFLGVFKVEGRQEVAQETGLGRLLLLSLHVCVQEI